MDIEHTFGSSSDDEPEELPEIEVWVNAGFGGGSHRCIIRCVVGEDSKMLLPSALVKELRMEPGDDLERTLDEPWQYVGLYSGTFYLPLNSLQWTTQAHYKRVLNVASQSNSQISQR